MKNNKKKYFFFSKFSFIKFWYFAAKYTKKQKIKIPGLSKPNSLRRVYFNRKKNIKIEDNKYNKWFFEYLDTLILSVTKYEIIKKKVKEFNIWISWRKELLKFKYECKVSHIDE